jgi:NADH-quinone oxidoreductase subunit N
MQFLHYMLPELILLVAAAVLFVTGASVMPTARKAAPVVALGALLLALSGVLMSDAPVSPRAASGLLSVVGFSLYIKAAAVGVGIFFVLLAWPTSKDGASNNAISFNTETGEYFALLLLALAGVCITASANSLPTLFLGIELASIPTYIMVTMSRPQVAAQEAGIKYFFLGAAAAALMLFGMSYLFGATGMVRFDDIARVLSDMRAGGAGMPPMVTLAVVLMLLGFGFKLAAFPMHFYAGDVYQGAATPVTAAISFIPKVTGAVAIISILHVVGGNDVGAWALDEKIVRLLWIMAVLTMTIGNVLGLLQHNVKRVMAYSSIAHSGYVLAGIATLATAATSDLRTDALAAVAMYLLAYGVMNTCVFGVLMLIPSRRPAQATTAETYDDLAGTARKHPLLGLAMAVGCLSLIGVPATVGFFGKFYLIRPAIISGNTTLLWLAIFIMVNATISAAYYLKIISVMWAKSDFGSAPDVLPDNAMADASSPGTTGRRAAASCLCSPPVGIAVVLCVTATVVFGVALPLTALLWDQSAAAALTFFNSR